MIRTGQMPCDGARSASRGRRIGGPGAELRRLVARWIAICCVGAALAGCVTSRRISSAEADPAESESAPPSLASAGEGGQVSEGATSTSTEPMPAHDLARTESARERVERTLRALQSETRLALGHQDTTAYGVGWKGDPDRSDVRSVCGSHVAVYGWDLFGIEKGAAANGDGVDFEYLRRLITDAHRRGGINTVSWHVDNPASGGDAWDTSTPALSRVVPGGDLHGRWIEHLDRLANYLQTLRGDRGELVPIIFRPYHEHTGSWFWWGGKNASERDYVTLWRHTVRYLKRDRGLSNLLFAFSPGGGEVHSEADYLYRYPGDAYVDVLGVDVYSGDPRELVRVARVASSVAERRGKVAAVTEFGARGGINAPGVGADWLRESLIFGLLGDALAARVAYALAWRNSEPGHAFMPYPGQRGEAALAAVCADSRVVLSRHLPL